MTNFCVRPYKARIFRLFHQTVTRVELTMLSIGLCGQWKWALSINPLEAWSAWSDSNRQGLRRRILSAVCLAISSHADIHLKPTSYLIAISSISSWMMSFCPYITFTIVSLCQWNTIASYGKCLLVIRRCLKLYPVSMPVSCDIDLTVIFKSCRALYCLSIPIPFIMPNRLTGAPYLASRSFARLRPAFMLISFILRTFPTFSIISYLILFVKR